MVVKSLGNIPVPDGTLEHDRVLAEGYCSFSGEMLRVGLLGITAVGFISAELDRKATWPLFACLVCLGVSVAAALLHRYFAWDSLACHLKLSRLELRSASGDEERITDEKAARAMNFTRSRCSLWVAGITLWLGVVSLATWFLLPE